MAYRGWLIKVGNYTIPANKYIRAGSFVCAPHVQDLDSYRDANGKLHRDALEHIPVKVEFETPAMLTDLEYDADFMANIRRNYINKTEKKAIVTVYVPEYNDYVTQEMYMPDIEPTMYGNYGGRIHYNATRIAFIGY